METNTAAKYEIRYSHKDVNGCEIDHPEYGAVYGDTVGEYGLVPTFTTRDEAEAAIVELDAVWQTLAATDLDDHGAVIWDTLPKFWIAEIKDGDSWALGQRNG